MNKDLEKEEILKSVEAALREDGTMLLACQSPSREGLTFVTRGGAASVTALLAAMMLGDDDVETASIVICAAKEYIKVRQREKDIADATVAATLKTLGIKTEDEK